MADTVVIEGEVSLITQIDGDPEVVIASGGGIVPSGTIEITSNGTYNVRDYASADVDVQGGVTPTGTKSISISANGTVTEDVTNYASAEITTNVPNSYSQADEGKVVDNGALVAQTTDTVTSNQVVDTTLINELTVAVPASAVDTGTKSISTNGTHDVTGYASASVNVPNSYSASDEGKVVDNGALVSQTSDTVTENDTYDTTLINSLTVNVSGGVSLLDVAKRVEPSGAVVLDDTSNFNIRPYLFHGYTGITSFSSNKAKELQSYAFQNCSNMTSVNCPNCTKLEASVFEGCSKLASITLSNNYSVLGNCFRQCTSLVDFDFWGNGTANAMFYGCSNLEKVDCKNLNLYNIQSNCFQNCTKLNVLIIRKTSDVVGLANISAFSSTPFASGSTGGTLYVPQSLISSYQNATNWSTILGYANNSIVAIEGSQYENY